MRYVRRPEKVSAILWKGDNLASAEHLFPDDEFDILANGFLMFRRRPIAVPIGEWLVRTTEGEAHIMGDRRFREEFMPVERVKSVLDTDWE